MANVSLNQTEHANITDENLNYTLYHGIPYGSDTKEKYIIPSMILVGAISNIFTLAVFCRGKQKRMSVSIYMAAFCIGNLSTLFLVYGMHLLTVVSDFPEMYNLSHWGCSIFTCFEKIVMFSSIWFVVGMTIDRYIAVCHPANAVTMCTVFMAKVGIGIILIGLVVVSVHAMWVFDLNSSGICMRLPGENDLQKFHLQMWNILSAFAYVYLPLLILLILNILLTFGLCFQHSSSSTSAQDNVSIEYTNTVVAISMSYFAVVFPITILNIMHISGVNVHKETHVQFDYVQRVNLVSVMFICLIFSRSYRQEICNMYRRILERRKHSLEMNRLSNKSLLTKDTTTSTNEEDTLI